MSPHFLVFVGVDRGVSDRASEAGGGPGRSHFARRVGVLAGKAEVEHVNLFHLRDGLPNGKVRRLDVAMEKSDLVNTLDGF